jgi:protein SCO1/2
LLTPGGRIARYLFGVQFAPRTLRLGLVEASQGRVGNVVDRLLLLCSHYDAGSGRYTPLIQRLLALFCGGGALLLGGALIWLRRRERHRLSTVAP